MKLLKAITAGLFLSAAAASSAMAEGDAKAGEQVFKRCANCHMVGPNAKNRNGPQLNDLFGRQLGAAADFKYSKVLEGMGAAGLKWTREDFTGYLEDPKGWLPVKAKEMGLNCGDLAQCRNRMAFVGLKKPQEVKDVIAFLLTHDKDGMPTE